MKTFNNDVFDAFPILQTKRLTLREIRIEDAIAIFNMRSNKRVGEFIARPQMQQHDDATQLAERTINAYRNKQAIGWAGVLRNGEGIIGTCGYNSIDVPNMHAEIGGEMATDFWGKYLAAEAFAAIIQFGLQHMNLHTIEAKVSPQNRSAIYLMEQIGFKKEAHYHQRIFFNNTFLDMSVYTLISGQENKQLLSYD